MMCERPLEPLDDDDPREYYRDTLERKFGSGIEIIDSTIINYIDDSDRIDPIFCINTKEYK